jgi:hypothetical protein
MPMRPRHMLLAGLAALLALGEVRAQSSAFFEFYASPATLARRAAASDKLADDLRASLNRTRGKGTWGVMVVSLTNGDTLFGHNVDRQLLPASTMKLYTSALALDKFGPQGRFETKLLHSGTISNDSVLTGDVVLRGAGDPTFSGTGRESPIVTLARGVSEAGVRRITGSLVADAWGRPQGSRGMAQPVPLRLVRGPGLGAVIQREPGHRHRAPRRQAGFGRLQPCRAGSRPDQQRHDRGRQPRGAHPRRAGFRRRAREREWLDRFEER